MTVEVRPRDRDIARLSPRNGESRIEAVPSPGGRTENDEIAVAVSVDIRRERYIAVGAKHDGSSTDVVAGSWPIVWNGIRRIRKKPPIVPDAVGWPPDVQLHDARARKESGRNRTIPELTPAPAVGQRRAGRAAANVPVAGARSPHAIVGGAVGVVISRDGEIAGRAPRNRQRASRAIRRCAALHQPRTSRGPEDRKVVGAVTIEVARRRNIAPRAPECIRCLAGREPETVSGVPVGQAEAAPLVFVPVEISATGPDGAFVRVYGMVACTTGSPSDNIDSAAARQAPTNGPGSNDERGRIFPPVDKNVGERSRTFGELGFGEMVDLIL